MASDLLNDTKAKKRAKSALIRHGFRAHWPMHAPVTNDMVWFGCSLEGAIANPSLFGRVTDATQAIVADVRLHKPAHAEDIRKAASKLRLNIDAADSLRVLSGEHGPRLMAILQKSGFDGAMGTFNPKDGAAAEAVAPTPGITVSHAERFNVLVAFEGAKIHVLEGAARRVALARQFSPHESGWGLGRTDEHLRICSGLRNATAPMSPQDFDDAIKATKLACVGFDVNALNPNGGALLLMAAAQQSIEHLEVFVKHGGNLHARDGAMTTALYHAMDDETIGWLLQRGLDIDAVDGQGKTPAHRKAESDGRENMLELLLLGADPSATDLMGDTPLHRVGRSVNLERVKAQQIELLIRAGADPNARNDEGHTPMHLAAAANNATAVLALAKFGAELDAEDARGLRPLHMASVLSNETTHLLIALGASPRGVVSHVPAFDLLLLEPPILAALRTRQDVSLPLFKACLDRGVGDDDLQVAVRAVKPDKFKEHAALLSAHMAKRAVDALINAQAPASPVTASRRVPAPL